MTALLAALDPLYGIVAAAILAPLGAYLLAARQFSGKVGTSDAAQLWEESRAIREWSTGRIAVLDSTVARLEGRIEGVELKNSELVRENDRLVNEVRHLTETIVELRGEIVNLTAELRASRQRVHELEKEADDQSLA